MGTLADKASKVLDTKQQIAAAIEEKTGENPGNVFSDYPDAIRAIPTGGSGWTGHADVEGLKAIGWTDEDIAYYQQHGVNWNEEDDAYHRVPEDNKALYGVINIDNIQDYKDIIVYLPKIDTTGVTDMSDKFQGLHSLVAVPMLDTSSVTKMSQMFRDCFSLTCVSILDTSQVSSIFGIFYQCYSLLFIPPFDLSNVSTLLYAFLDCQKIVDIPPFNTVKLTSLQQAFRHCNSIIRITGIDTSNVTDMSISFYNCYALSVIELDVSKANFNSTTFYRCYSLRICNLSGLKSDIDISATSILEKSSLLYMIENAVPTDAITITLSAYCYNKFSNDPDVVAALSAQPLVSLASA